jgi:CheY-like chemotaxis protein
MFTQVDRTSERSQTGLGIGLTLSKRLVELHGGTIEARSEGLGYGSEFVVHLPILLELDRREEPKVTAPPKVEPQSILVVDDNVDAAGSLVRLLKVSGHKTFVAHDGLTAIAEAKKHQPDVVLLDVGLPKLDGHEACRRIRSQPWGKTMLIVALTGWSQDEDRRKSKEAGFDAHMVKPLNFDELTRLLARRESVGANAPESALI